MDLENSPTGFLALVSSLFVFGFLTWATATAHTNLAGLLRVTVVRAVRLTLGAMSGILCERGGLFINIAIEGMMLTAAFVSTVFASISHNLFIGLIAGVLAGGVMGWIHGVLCIKYKVNQIISGTVINIFATGITSYLSCEISSKSTIPVLELNRACFLKLMCLFYQRSRLSVQSYSVTNLYVYLLCSSLYSC